jgi:hypothetical protein
MNFTWIQDLEGIMVYLKFDSPKVSV